MTTIFIIGRIVFGLYWLMSAYNHLFKSAPLVQYATFKKVPSPKFAVIGSGVLLLIGALSILSGDWTRCGILLLVIFLLSVSFSMHAFWKDTDATMKMNNMINFTKNMALVGALLMLLSLPTPWLYSWF